VITLGQIRSRFSSWSDEIASATPQPLLGVNKVTLHEIEAKSIVVCGDSLVQLAYITTRNSNEPGGGTMDKLSLQNPVFACPFREFYPDVLVVQSGQDRNGDNGARSLDCSM